MAEEETRRVLIDPEVAMEEDRQLLEHYKNRNLLLAQFRKESNERLAHLEARVSELETENQQLVAQISGAEE